MRTQEEIEARLIHERKVWASSDQNDFYTQATEGWIEALEWVLEKEA